MASEFVRLALEAQLKVVQSEIHAAGYELALSPAGEFRLIVSGDAVKALPAPSAIEAEPIARKVKRRTGGAKSCDEPGCGRPHLARGYCSRHYAQLIYREKQKGK